MHEEGGPRCENFEEQECSKWRQTQHMSPGHLQVRKLHLYILHLYTYGRVLRTQEPGSQPQVLSQLLSGLTASLRFLSGGRPPGMKASFRFSAGSGEGRAGVATRNRSFETWALSITKTTFLQRRVDFLSPRPTACCADRERYQLRFLQVLTSHRARSRQPQVLSGPDHKAA